MSLSYWGICGYGVRLNDILDYIDKEKVNKIVRQLRANEELDGDVFEDDTFFGNPYNGIGELLCSISGERVFTFNRDGDSDEYFLYTPTFPWDRLKEEPQSLEEMSDRMVAVLKQIYTLSDEELKTYIEYIDTAGWG